MKKPIMAQLLILLDSFPPIISDASIEFLVDPKAFAVALMAACGQLKKTGADSKVWWHFHFQLITHTHTHPFNGPLSGTTWVSRYQRGKTNLDFTEAKTQ